ncbi:MAG: Fic family protein [Acidimicrobiales bacterium]
MIRPSLELAVAFNEAVREDDEWFDEPDDLERVAVALATIEAIEDPVEAAAVLVYRVTRAQAFGEANKRTALLLARWLLDRNGLDGGAVIPAEDRRLADLLIKAAAGSDVGDQILLVLKEKA